MEKEKAKRIQRIIGWMRYVILVLLLVVAFAALC
jgi:hypothetical protein